MQPAVTPQVARSVAEDISYTGAELCFENVLPIVGEILQSAVYVCNEAVVGILETGGVDLTVGLC